MSWGWTTSGAAIAKAGAGAAWTDIDEADLTKWSDQIEATINTLTRKDWIATSAAIKATFLSVLDDLESDMIAMRIIAYDMGGYTSRAEAQTILNVISQNIDRNLAALKDWRNKEKM